MTGFFFFVLALLAVPICAVEGWPLYRDRRWGELAVFGIIIAAALAVGLWRVFSPLAALGRWLRPLGEALFRHI